MSSGWQGVRKGAPCPACGGTRRCAWNGELLHCFATKMPSSGMRFVKPSPSSTEGAFFAPDTKSGQQVGRAATTISSRTRSVTSRDFSADLWRLRSQLASASRDELAVALGVAGASLGALQLGWATALDLKQLGAGPRDKFGRTDGAFAIPEFDGQRALVGFAFRTIDGAKGAAAGSIGSRRGLVIPSDFDESKGCILVVEGASDVAALHSLGLRAVGRPSNTGGADFLARLLKDYPDFIVLGENDKKPDGRFPGHEGMTSVSRALANALGRPVRAALPPQASKDVRQWLQARRREGLDLADRDACARAGRELLAELEGASLAIVPDSAPNADTAGLRGTELVRGEMPRVARAIEAALSDHATAPPLLFQRQGVLVHVVRLERALSGKVSIEAGPLVIREASVPLLQDRIARVGQLLRRDRRGVLYAVDPPAELAKAIQSHVGSWPFPCLVGIVEAPQVFRDGRILERSGYDGESGLLLDPGTVRFPQLPVDPTRDDAVQRLDRIDQALLSGFTFVDDSDRSAALAMLLSAVCRTAYGSGPAFCITAPTQSCGKSTLASLPAILATGHGPVVISPGRSEEETDKRILAVLLEGHRHVCFDNLRSGDELDAPAIAKAITEPEYSGRPLGRTGTLTLSTEAVLWVCTGVGIVPRGDAFSRTVVLHLDLGVEKPWQHRWPSPDPRLVARERRGELVADALTIARSFILAGCPTQQLRPSRFTEWDRLVRGVLVWLGRVDPLQSTLEADAHDPESDALDALLEFWDDALGHHHVTTAQAVERFRREKPDRRAAVLAVAASGDSPTQIDPRRLGNFLSRCERRVVGGRRFLRVGTSGTRTLWKLERMPEPSLVSPLVEHPEHASGWDDPDESPHPGSFGAVGTVANCANCANCAGCSDCDPGSVVCETKSAVPVTGDGIGDEPNGTQGQSDASPQPAPSQAQRADLAPSRGGDPASTLDVLEKSSLHVRRPCPTQEAS
jgi:hypothetical protein